MVDPTSFTVAVVGLASAIGAAGIALRSKKIEVAPIDLASVRATIVSENARLQADNTALRGEMGLLNAEIAGLRVDIRELQLDLDKCRGDLALERRSRRAGDAGLAAERKATDRGDTRAESRKAGADAHEASNLKDDES